MGPLSYMRSVVEQNVAVWPTAVLAKIFVFCILFCVKSKCSSYFSCSLGLLYNLLLIKVFIYQLMHKRDALKEC